MDKLSDRQLAVLSISLGKCIDQATNPMTIREIREIRDLVLNEMLKRHITKRRI